MPVRRRISAVAGRRGRVAALRRLALAALALGFPISAWAQLAETAAPHAHMIDVETGTVLLSKQGDAPLPPASMAKLMTLEVTFEALDAGELSLRDEFFISEHAWRTGGAPSRSATMFAEINSNVPLADLLRGLIVQTANDAAIAIAEGMSGSEEAFAVVMNERAGELGLADTRFANPTGAPAPDQKASMRDLVRLARHVIEEHPRYYRIFGEPEFTWNGIRQLNKIPLVGGGLGVDGLVAGYDEETGFGMVASAEKDGQRILLAVHGLDSIRARETEVQKLLSWGFSAFERMQLFAAGEAVGEIDVYGGSPGHVAVASREPIEILVPRGGPANLRARIVYNGPLAAPVEEGAEVAMLRVYTDDTLLSEAPLIAVQSAGVAALHHQALDAALELAIGLIHSGVEAATSR